jgi:hypothetical protein
MNQKSTILGYRDLSKDEITLINECKALAEIVGNLCDRIGSEKLTNSRWLDESRMEIQKGFMCLIRSIAQPTTF